jgi:hypothetical protein
MFSWPLSWLHRDPWQTPSNVPVCMSDVRCPIISSLSNNRCSVFLFDASSDTFMDITTLRIIFVHTTTSSGQTGELICPKSLHTINAGWILTNWYVEFVCSSPSKLAVTILLKILSVLVAVLRRSLLTMLLSCRRLVARHYSASQKKIRKKEAKQKKRSVIKTSYSKQPISYLFSLSQLDNESRK